MGIGIRRRPPRISEGSVPIHLSDIVNYVAQDEQSVIILKFVSCINMLYIEIKYASGSFNDTTVNHLVRNLMVMSRRQNNNI